MGQSWGHFGRILVHLGLISVVRRLWSDDCQLLIICFCLSDGCLFLLSRRLGSRDSKKEKPCQQQDSCFAHLPPMSPSSWSLLALCWPCSVRLGSSSRMFGPPWHHLGLTLRFGRSILTRSGLHLILASLRAILAPSRSSWSFLARWHIT